MARGTIMALVVGDGPRLTQQWMLAWPRQTYDSFGIDWQEVLRTVADERNQKRALMLVQIEECTRIEYRASMPTSWRKRHRGWTHASMIQHRREKWVAEGRSAASLIVMRWGKWLMLNPGVKIDNADLIGGFFKTPCSRPRRGAQRRGRREAPLVRRRPRNAPPQP